jgi:hypothetical protein
MTDVTIADIVRTRDGSAYAHGLAIGTGASVGHALGPDGRGAARRRDARRTTNWVPSRPASCRSGDDFLQTTRCSGRVTRPTGPPWRALYRRVGDAVVVLAVAPEAARDRRGFDRAVAAAERRLREVEE